MRRTAWLAALTLGLLAGSGAKADGFPPFFGYSGYFGAPTTYYTRHPDVQQATRMVDGYQGFGVTTYTTGGPFWGYKSHRRILRERRVRETVRVKG
ncbi:hypothetical protein [Enterovirga sp.]|jgi:hypothetical protein|uniref:hypothetical protein n=1 Tax=Enterovirga sp. TaxID=2026350 RepID=UPI0026109ABF|nr:hypothetical protein [Enterovirga sp.]MDB5592465.1 hypothetical protein [Enterovirga sp.]